jgi:cytochrome c2
VLTDTESLTETEEITATEAADEEATGEEEASDAEATEEAAADEAATEEDVTEEDAAEEETVAVDERYAGLPDNILAALENADPERGAQLTQQSACIACHNLDPSVTQPGPSWHNLAVTAAERVPDQSAALYLYTSIVHPNDFIVEGYPSGLMVPTFGETLSDQDLADLIAYLLTLEADES